MSKMSFNRYPYSAYADEDGIMELIGKSQSIVFDRDKFNRYAYERYTHGYCGSSVDICIQNVRDASKDEKSLLVECASTVECILCKSKIDDEYCSVAYAYNNDSRICRQIFTFELDGEYRSEGICCDCQTENDRVVLYRGNDEALIRILQLRSVA